MKNKTRWKILDLYRKFEDVWCWLLIPMILAFSLLAESFFERVFGATSDAAVICGMMTGIALTYLALVIMLQLHIWLDNKLYYWALNEK
jgi:hypothetical protein